MGSFHQMDKGIVLGEEGCGGQRKDAGETECARGGRLHVWNMLREAAQGGGQDVTGRSLRWLL